MKEWVSQSGPNCEMSTNNAENKDDEVGAQIQIKMSLKNK